MPRDKLQGAQKRSALAAREEEEEGRHVLGLWQRDDAVRLHLHGVRPLCDQTLPPGGGRRR